MNDTYSGNLNLKAAGVKQQFTKEQIEEYIRCKQSPEYFIEKYLKIIHVDSGIIPLHLRPFQKKIVSLFNNNRYVILRCCRQSGKTTSYVAYLTWYVIFNDHQTVAILANKAEIAQEILSRIQLAYEQLPKWIQQGVIIWNKRSLELENGSKI